MGGGKLRAIVGLTDDITRMTASIDRLHRSIQKLHNKVFVWRKKIENANDKLYAYETRMKKI